MRTTKNVRIVLTGALQATERLENSDLRAFDRQDFEALGIRYDLRAWLGRSPTASETSSINRTVKRMESEGLLECNAQWAYLGGVSRTTHVKLTPAGERLGKQVRQHAATE